MGATPHNKTRYAAFISYAHADEVMAARLHKALETYPVPKHLRKQGKTTKPVFRDVAELTAAHSLSEKIRDAVKGSRVLIVLCSPAAKASHWVNEEIRLFRELHGDAAILSAIIDGTPGTAFPQALTEDGREPLAAALGSDKAGFRLGVTQLAAGMLGTGLDDLVQRESKRRNRLMGTGLAASLALSGIMGFTTLQAVEARNEAELERAESETLLEYMVKDLKVKLEPAGRLELLEGVGRKAADYYIRKDIANLSDDNLTTFAAARQVLAKVALDAGRIEEAQREIKAAAALTGEVLERNPDDTNAIFAHAQSEFWVGEYFFKQGKLSETEKPYREYDRLAQILYQTDPTNFDWVMEAGWGKNNLGSWARDLQSQELAPMAFENYTRAISYFEEAIAVNPNSKLAKTELANAMRGNAQILLAFETASTAQEYTLNYIDLLKSLLAEHPKDIILLRDLYDSEIDYYHNHFLSLDDDKKTALLEALDELFSLVQDDTQNLTYVNYFLRAITKTSECFDLPELIKRKDQLEKILKGMPKENGLNHKYYSSMTHVMGIKINYLKGDENVAKEQLRELRELYSNMENHSPQDWNFLYHIFLRHQELGDEENTKKFAKLFLDQINLRSDLEYPKRVFSVLNAKLALEDCVSAKNLARNLKVRGYLKRSDVKPNSCSDLQSEL